MEVRVSGWVRGLKISQLGRIFVWKMLRTEEFGGLLLLGKKMTISYTVILMQFVF